MPKPFLKSDFTPAVRDPNSGTVYTGFDHNDALKKAEAAGVKFQGSELGPTQAGFLRKDGTFFTRAQTMEAYGFKNSADLR